MVEKISIEIGLEGGKEVERQLADIGKAGQDAFGQIQKAAEATTFEAATQSIAKLGSTAEEALAGAAAAAQKFGASAGELGKVEGIIGALGARAKDGTFSFSQLAANYDKARAAAVGLGDAATTVVSGVRTLGDAAAGAARGFALTRTEISGLRLALRELGLGQIAGQFAPLLTLGSKFGTTTAAFVGVGAAIAAATTKTVAFAEAINKTSDEAVKLGLSFAELKNLQQEFQKLGVTGEAAASGFAKFQQELQKAAQADPGGQLAAFGLTAAAAKQQLDQFLERLRQMPDGLERTNLAISQLGETAGIQFIQGLRAAEGSMAGNERKAFDLGQAFDRLKTAWINFGSVEAAPAITSGLDLVTAGVEKLGSALERTAPKWGILGFAAKFALSPVAATLELTSNAFSQTGQTAQQAGQQAAQGLQLVTNPLTGMPELVRTANTAFAQLGQTGEQAGQQTASGLQLVTNPLTGMPELIKTANQEIAKTGPAAQQAGQQGAQGFQPWIDALGGVATKSNEAATAAQQVKAPETSSWTSWASTALSALQSVIDKLAELARQGGPKLGGAGGVQVGGAASGGLIGGRGSGTSDSNLAWVSRGEFVVNAASVRHFGAGFFAALNAGRIPRFQAGGVVGAAPAGDPLQKIDQIAQQTARIDANVNTVINMLTDIGGGMQSLAEGIARLIQTVERVDNNVIATNTLIGQLIRDVSKAISQKAGGGLIGGRGTSTSDSNLAWLSRGEFVINAASVRRFGAQFFALLNAGIMPRFAFGGMVPAFAGGGLAGSSNVTIQFPGLPPIAGLRASSEVVGELQRAAALAQVRSGGRKPSRYS